MPFRLRRSAPYEPGAYERLRREIEHGRSVSNDYVRWAEFEDRIRRANHGSNYHDPRRIGMGNRLQAMAQPARPQVSRRAATIAAIRRLESLYRRVHTRDFDAVVIVMPDGSIA